MLAIKIKVYVLFYYWVSIQQKGLADNRIQLETIIFSS